MAEKRPNLRKDPSRVHAPPADMYDTARCVSGLNSCLKVLFNTESPAVLRGVGSNPTLVNIFVLFPF